MENENVTYFDKMKITSKGLGLIHKLIATGKPLRIKRAVIGDGIPEQDAFTLTELVHEIPSHQTGQEGTSAIVDLQMCSPEDEQATLTRVRVQNGDTDFIWREIGIIANDPDDGEILYAYSVDRTEHAMSFPAFDGVPITGTVDVAFFVSNSTNIIANITLPAEVSPEEFAEHRNAAELDHPDKSVKNRHIADSAIGAVQIANGAVSKEKLSDELNGLIQSVTDELSLSIIDIPKTNTEEIFVMRDELTPTNYPGGMFDDIQVNKTFIFTNLCGDIQNAIYMVNDEVGYTMPDIPSNTSCICKITSKPVIGADSGHGAVEIVKALPQVITEMDMCKSTEFEKIVGGVAAMVGFLHSDIASNPSGGATMNTIIKFSSGQEYRYADIIDEEFQKVSRWDSDFFIVNNGGSTIQTRLQRETGNQYLLTAPILANGSHICRISRKRTDYQCGVIEVCLTLPFFLRAKEG